MINKIIEKYKIVRSIGEGGMAKVYEAIHIRLGSRVAIKILNEELVKKTNIRQRFENEARIMADLDHRNIVKIIDYIDNDNLLAIVMEMLHGATLTDYLRSKKKLSKDEILQIFNQVLSAFNLAHQRGIIHRDIKPANIFIETHNHNNVKILDFGIAKLISSDLSITNSGAQMGSPLYMSPEQVKDSSNLDNLSDIYSLGVVLYHMVTGKPPYNSTTLSRFDIFNKIVYEPLPQLSEHSEFNAIIQKATQKEPNQRYATCQEFAKDLEKIGKEDFINTSTNITVNSKKKSQSNTANKRKLNSNKKTPSKAKLDSSKKRLVSKRKKPKSNKKESGKAGFIVGLLLLLGVGIAAYFMFFNKTNEVIVVKTPKTKKTVTPTIDEPKKITPKPFDVLLGDGVFVNAASEISDGDYIAVGYKLVNGAKQAWSNKISRKGNTSKWKINGAENIVLTQVVNNKKGELIVAGNIENQKQSIFLAKYNNDKKIFMDDLYDQKVVVNALTTGKNNSIVVAGFSKQRKRREEPFIAKITEPSRNIQVSNITGSNRKDVIYDAITVSDGYVFVGEKSSKVWVLKTNKQLNEVWNKTFDIGKKANSIVQYKKNLYIVGEVFSASNEDINIFMLKLNKDGEKILFSTFGNDKTFEIKPYITISDGEVIVAATQTDDTNGSVIPIYRMNINGNIRENKTEIIKKKNYTLVLNSLISSADNGILMLMNQEQKTTKTVQGRIKKIYLK